MTDHVIKCWPQQFWAIRSGLKTFEYRKNDRGYRVGDTLVIREYDPKTKAFSGAEVRRTVTHMLASGFGLPDGYAVLGLGDTESENGSWELTEAQQQAQGALDKVMNCRFSNFDAGAVIHWAERGQYQVKTDPAPQSNSQAINDIVAERHRQIISEGWTLHHDDKHAVEELSAAATCYAAAASITTNLGGRPWDHKPPFENWPGFGWPWDIQWWKPGTARRMLVKAAALIIAEIERLDRADIAKSQGGDA